MRMATLSSVLLLSQAFPLHLNNMNLGAYLEPETSLSGPLYDW